MEWCKYTKYSKWTGIPEKNKKGENEAARKLPDIQISPRKKKVKKKLYNPRETKNRKMKPVSTLIKFSDLSQGCQKSQNGAKYLPGRKKMKKKRYNPSETKNRKMKPVLTLIKFSDLSQGCQKSQNRADLGPDKICLNFIRKWIVFWPFVGNTPRAEPRKCRVHQCQTCRFKRPMKLQRTEKEWNGTSTPSTANGQESPEKKKEKTKLPGSCQISKYLLGRKKVKKTI